MTRHTKPSKPRDVVTLADLSPRHRVTGGSARRVFGAEGPAGQTQDSITLLRQAKPVKDLAVRKDVKGGKKATR